MIFFWKSNILFFFFCVLQHQFFKFFEDSRFVESSLLEHLFIWLNTGLMTLAFFAFAFFTFFTLSATTLFIATMDLHLWSLNLPYSFLSHLHLKWHFHIAKLFVWWRQYLTVSPQVHLTCWRQLYDVMPIFSDKLVLSFFLMLHEFLYFTTGYHTQYFFNNWRLFFRMW